jgi:hypothetical protein
MSIELKIKSKHLSEEAKIIRFEERKLKRQIDWQRNNNIDPEKLRWQYINIKEHRRIDVRNENRATFLARAYLAGRKYEEVEKKRHDDNTLIGITNRIVDMVNKYGPTLKKVTREDIYKWANV